MNRRDFLRFSIAANVGLAAFPMACIPQIAGRVDDPEVFTGREVFARLLAKAQRENWRKLPIGDMMGRIGMELRGVPYVGATLELHEDREVCSVNLLGLDCVTFFESALGFARMLRTGGTTPEDLLTHVTYTRYRNGKITDYASRLHYTTDWFHDNQAKGVVTVITRELPGAERFTTTVNFMSTHPDSYKQLKANPKLIPVIREIEDRINDRRMHYIPKEKVAAIEPQLRTGDIIGITTTINGIDCSHTGLCYRDGERLRFLHASTGKKEVTLDEELHKYLASITRHTGIMVARPVEL